MRGKKIGSRWMEEYLQRERLEPVTDICMSLQSWLPSIGVSPSSNLHHTWCILTSACSLILVQIASLARTNWIQKCASPNGMIEKTEEGLRGKALCEIAYCPWSLPLYNHSCLSSPPQTKICEIQSGTWILLSLHIMHLASQPSGRPDWCLPT